MGEGVKSVLNPNNLETIPTQNISLHLVIFQHGFLGNSFDMRMLSQVLAILAEDYPQSNLMV
ncbi:MAG: putative lipase [Actinobacteria bacterium]|nr:putative lipase [Actinomycetota bacterium]